MNIDTRENITITIIDRAKQRIARVTVAANARGAPANERPEEWLLREDSNGHWAIMRDSEGEASTRIALTPEECTEVIKHAGAAATVEESEALARTKMSEVCALHQAWMLLGDRDIETCHTGHEEVEEAARALVADVAIRAGWRKLEGWEDPHEPLLEADTCRLKIPAQSVTIEIKCPMMHAEGEPQIKVREHENAPARTIKVEPHWTQATGWLATLFGAD